MTEQEFRDKVKRYFHLQRCVGPYSYIQRQRINNETVSEAHDRLLNELFSLAGELREEVGE